LDKNAESEPIRSQSSMSNAGNDTQPSVFHDPTLQLLLGLLVISLLAGVAMALGIFPISCSD
jgi:hypothetical protein